MRDIFTIIKFTMKDMIKRKSFVISTIIILLMIVIGFNVPNIINSFKGSNDKNTIIINDVNNLFEGHLDLLKTNEEYNIVISNDDISIIREQIINETADMGIVISKKDNTINLTYIVNNSLFYSGNEYLDTSIPSLYKQIQINKLNITEEEKQMINPNFETSIIEADTEPKGNVMVMMMMSIVLFYAVYFCAFQVSSSITVEKTSKIIETLVTSTSPKNIVLGKTIGIGLVGLIQLTLILLTAYISANAFMDPLVIKEVLDMSSITLSLGLITLLYFVLGYAVFALMYALTGSTVSKPEDIQSANSPVVIISLIGFYLSYFTMMNPNSGLNKIASILPISSPFCMPFRIMMGLANVQDVLISILILIITIILIAKITIKIYSNAIINYGSKLSIKDIKSLYKQK